MLWSGRHWSLNFHLPQQVARASTPHHSSHPLASTPHHSLHPLASTPHHLSHPLALTCLHSLHQLTQLSSGTSIVKWHQHSIVMKHLNRSVAPPCVAPNGAAVPHPCPQHAIGFPGIPVQASVPSSPASKRLRQGHARTRAPMAACRVRWQAHARAHAHLRVPSLPRSATHYGMRGVCCLRPCAGLGGLGGRPAQERAAPSLRVHIQAAMRARVL